MKDVADRVRARDFIPLVVVVLLIVGYHAYVRATEPDTYALTADLPRAVALYRGNSVVVEGIDVGSVEDVELVGEHVRITLGIRDDFPIPADARLDVVPSALLGEREVRLGPMFDPGDERMEPGTHIPRDRTRVPVELDEALDGISRVLEDIDGETLARFVDVGAEELAGRGAVLNEAVERLAALTRTMSGSDDSVDRIIENADVLTAAVASRDTELGVLLDTFATASGTVAAEREQIVRLVDALAVLSEEGTDLLAEHDAALRRDLDVTARLGRSLAVNADILPNMLAGVSGFFDATAGAYRPAQRAAVARFAMTPELVDQLEPLLVFLGVRPCVALDVQCDPVGPPDAREEDGSAIDPDTGSVGGVDLLPPEEDG